MEATPEELTPDAARVHGMLQSRGASLATAESLTGGLLGAILTNVQGASATYRGGVVVYATDLKSDLLGVPEELLEERGPVDADVAAAMASAVRDRLRADWGVALTGVAGPERQGGKDVGTVYVAVSGPGRTTTVERLFPGSRNEIRIAACRDALHALYDRLAAGE
ncbi:MAG TPA: CinA family protein [Mycobacteriales bacterium]|nr:CinA family protein [Mycobacteriales bacterium]